VVEWVEENIETYYRANVLLEKLRIWKGEKKTKAREKAEQQYA
jgi:hypothetical protein